MAIPDEDVARVRAATDIVALIGERTALKRQGRRFVGLCPFHNERSPSFSVNAEEGLYYCFGCQASGDAISFVRALEGCDFVEAVERLAARAGVTVRNEEDARTGADRARRRQLYEALSEAVAFYHSHLLNGRDSGPARHYLRSRGYDGDIVRQFRLGFAPSGFDELVRRLRLPSRVLVEAGLAWEGRGRLQDAFRERVIFPIFDAGDRPIALGGRVLPSELRRSERDPGPKYRNSAESPIYQKRRTLYGLNWAKSDVAHTGIAVVCEGYTDVIGFFRAGVPRAVATCGTSLTEDHIKLLANFAKRVVLAFDADKAGQNAAARLFDWERLHRVELAVASFPPGSDPAELASSDPSALVRAVDEAQPILGFQINRVLAEHDLTAPESRARAARAALAVLAAHPDALVRDEYLVQIADRTRLDLARLRPLLDEATREGSGPVERPRPAKTGAAVSEDDGPPPRDEDAPPDERAGAGRPAASGPARRDRAPRAGADALALAIHEPAAVAPLYDEVMFVDPLQRAAFRALAQATELHEAIESSSPEVAELIRRLAVTDLPADADVAGTFVACVRLAVESALAALNSEARQGVRSDEEDRLRTVAALKEELEVLREPVEGSNGAAALDAATRLVAWLAQREGSTT